MRYFLTLACVLCLLIVGLKAECGHYMGLSLDACHIIDASSYRYDYDQEQGVVVSQFFDGATCEGEAIFAEHIPCDSDGMVCGPSEDCEGFMRFTAVETKNKCRKGDDGKKDTLPSEEGLDSIEDMLREESINDDAHGAGVLLASADVMVTGACLAAPVAEAAQVEQDMGVHVEFAFGSYMFQSCQRASFFSDAECTDVIFSGNPRSPKSPMPFFRDSHKCGTTCTDLKHKHLFGKAFAETSHGQRFLALAAALDAPSGNGWGPTMALGAGFGCAAVALAIRVWLSRRAKHGDYEPLGNANVRSRIAHNVSLLLTVFAVAFLLCAVVLFFVTGRGNEARASTQLIQRAIRDAKLKKDSITLAGIAAGFGSYSLAGAIAIGVIGIVMGGVYNIMDAVNGETVCAWYSVWHCQECEWYSFWNCF